MDFEQKFYKFLDKLADDEEFEKKWIKRNKEASEDVKKHLDEIEKR